MPAAKPTHPTVAILSWPGLSMTFALQAVLFVEELPGIGEDFERMAQQITPTFAEDIRLFLLARMPTALMTLGLKHDSLALEPPDFVDWVAALDQDDLATHAFSREHHERISRGTSGDRTASNRSDDPTDWLHSIATTAQKSDALQLFGDPAKLKTFGAKTLKSFWREYFHRLYTAHAGAMQAVEKLLVHHHPSEKPFEHVEQFLGRQIPDAPAWLSHYSRFLLVPFPFMGPYIVTADTDEPEPTLFIGFDADHVMSHHAGVSAGPDISKLKALADETRLEILRYVGRSERFGRDIVTHLGISQPGVSRHLRLLSASGLLHVRQEGTSKYYSCDDAVLDAVAESLRNLKADQADDVEGGRS